MTERIIFMGTPDFAVWPLASLVDAGFDVVAAVCQPDRPQGRRMTMVPPPVKRYAAAHGIEVLQPEKIRTPDFEAQLRKRDPDLIITAAYGRILPPNILAVPRRGCLNVHASLLPAYRGAAPIQWAIVRGEQETGITIMLMDEGMDTGDILRQQSISIPDDMDAEQLTDALARLGADMLPAVVTDWLAGRIEPRQQDPDKAFAIPVLTRDSGLIDWTLSSQAVHNLVRGLYPWPGAFTFCGEKRLKVHRARVSLDPQILDLAANQPPGTICLCSRTAITVACGQGAIDLLEVQSESGKRMHCRDCAHNYRLGQLMGGN